MPLLVDGHNLIGKLPDLHLSDPNDEQKLIVRLRAYAARASKRVVVVFDPARDGSALPSLWQQQQATGNVTAVWADAGKRADDVIRDRVGQFKDRQGWLVITSDAAVAGFVRSCGVKVQPSEDFVRTLIAGSAEAIFAEADKPVPSRKDAQAWSDVFKDPNPEPYKPGTVMTPQQKRNLLEEKRLRRNAQLARQVQNQRKLS